MKPEGRRGGAGGEGQWSLGAGRTCRKWSTVPHGRKPMYKPAGRVQGLGAGSATGNWSYASLRMLITGSGARSQGTFRYRLSKPHSGPTECHHGPLTPEPGRHRPAPRLKETRVFLINEVPGVRESMQRAEHKPSHREHRRVVYYSYCYCNCYCYCYCYGQGEAAQYHCFLSAVRKCPFHICLSSKANRK